MQAAPIRLVVVIGSTRPGRFGPTVAGWFAARARQDSRYVVDVLDLAETPLPAAFGDVADRSEQEMVAAVAGRLDAADAFVIVTPEYNHSFPASLKNALDWLGGPWRGRPVGFVSYGGLSGGLRAVEQLRLVLAELHATTLRETISFHNHWERFDDSGEPRDREATEAAATRFLNQLAWWGEGLRQARAAMPYPA